MNSTFPVRQHLLVIAAAILGSSVVMLGESVVTLALPSIARTLQVPFQSLQWAVDGYNLTLSAFILLGGAMGDLFGLRRVFLWSGACFLVLSLACAFAPNGSWLILLRSLLGVAGAALTPVSLAILNAELPEEMRSRAIGYWTAATSIVLAAGPLVGGYLVDLFSWRAIFLFNVPLALSALLLGFSALRKHPAHGEIRIDFLGALLAFLFLGGLTFGLIEGPARDWPTYTLLSLVLGAASFMAFIWRETTARHPLVDLTLFKNRNFAATNGATLLLYAGFGGFGFLFSYFLQTIAGFSATAAGAAFLPVSIMLALFAGKAGAYSKIFGPRWFMTLGPILCAAGMLLLLPLGSATRYLTGILPSVLIFAAGLVLVVAPLTATALNSAPVSKSGIASAINNGLSSAGALIVIALLGLAGPSRIYVFGILLCAALAIAAGVVALLFIRKEDPLK